MLRRGRRGRGGLTGGIMGVWMRWGSWCWYVHWKYLRIFVSPYPSRNGQILLLDADDRRLAGREELGAEWLLFVHLGLMYESQMASFGPGKEWMV